jgi:hypothetical protein
MLSLHQKQVIFASLVPALIRQAFALGYDVTLGEVLRTPEQAQWYADRGKGSKNSLHCNRLAMDLCLFKDGKYLTQTEDYKILGEWWEQQSQHDYQCCWGGHFDDGNHFSIAHGGMKGELE